MSTRAPIAAPRRFNPEAGLPGAGLPGGPSPMAARRAFADLKLAFLDALDGVAGQEAVWLRQQVLSAEDPVDLWLLRAPTFAALAGAERRARRQQLRRALDGLFPDSQPASGFSPL